MSKENTALVGTSYWELERVVAWSFNRLKGKIYNLVEASINDQNQQKALKGLIKGFANDEYKLCTSEMRYCGRMLNLLSEGEDTEVPQSAEPLENSGGVFAS